MNERKTLRRLKAGDTAALGEIVTQYTPYVYAIASNIAGAALSPANMEEITADVFTALWYSRESVEPGKLKPWLASVARNKAKSTLRSLHIAEPLDDDVVILAPDDTERDVLIRELNEAARMAVDALGELDSEIFKRHYFLYETADEIGAALCMNSATVRTRLARGRKVLRAYLEERGYSSEDTAF